MKFNEYYFLMMEDKKKNLPTKEMDDWFLVRTNKHIENVRFFMDKLVDKYPELEERKELHDLSKFEPPERIPYTWITFKYKCQDDDDLNFEDYNPPEDIDDLMNKATHHHITTNSHHAEYHSPNQTDLLNRDDRDKAPDKMVDATAMPEIDLVEMCCDWSGMSKEKGGDPRDWAKSNIGTRWEFTKKQEKIIMDTLDEIWVEEDVEK